MSEITQINTIQRLKVLLYRNWKVLFSMGYMDNA